jgi:two-component system sensor histidine kinase MprB
VSLRARVALLVASVTAAALLVVGVGSWLVVRSELRDEVDGQLDVRAALAVGAPGDPRPRRGGLLFGLDDTLRQTIDADGALRGPAAVAELPVTDAAVEVARGDRSQARYDATVLDAHVRVLAIGRGDGQAMLLARTLEGVDDALARLARILTVAGLLGTVGAGAAGYLFAGRSLRPVEELTRAAEHVAATQELDAHIAVDRSDELGRLATSFEQMLRALETSRRQQQQLVDDASHELRTPLTSLRTNVELLRRVGDLDLPPEQRQAVLDDVLAELDELTSLVTELVDLAADQRTEAPAMPVDLGFIAEAVVERHRRRTDAPIRLVVEGGDVVAGDPALIERAVSNLVDNAVKWSPPGEPIDVEVRASRVTVRDRGPGIDPADRERAFDRFWRAESARGQPGSGLGLSIVRKVVDAHGGRACLLDPADGGPGTLAVLDFSPASQPLLTPH